MNRDKIFKMIPNLLTFFNGLLGITAAALIAWSDLPGKVLVAAALIAAGAFVDFLDGYLARKLNATSDFGKQLDSFADLITFGIAPLFMLHYLAVVSEVAFVIPISIIYLIAAVYRLARFNVNDFSKIFMGLPITVAGVSLTIFCTLYFLWGGIIGENIFAISAVIFCAILAVLMVSRVKVRRI